MNVATLKTLSYLTSFGLLGGIIYVGYEYYEHGQNKRYHDQDETIALLRSVEPPPPPARSGLDYTDDVKPAIVEFDWTGKLPPPPPGPVDIDTPTTEPVATPVAEFVEVVWTLCDNRDPVQSHCMLRVADTPVDLEQHLFFIGDSLPDPHSGVAIFDIEPGAVVFSFADEEREREVVRASVRRGSESDLIFVTDPENIRVPKRQRFDERPATKTVEGPRQTYRENGQYVLGGDDIQTFNDDYGRILSEDVSVETYYKDGKRAGLKIRDVKAGSIAARHGVQAEDILISINGTPVTSEQEAIQYVKRNSETTTQWRVTFIRNGREQTELYRSPE